MRRLGLGLIQRTSIVQAVSKRDECKFRTLAALDAGFSHHFRDDDSLSPKHGHMPIYGNCVPDAEAVAGRFLRDSLNDRCFQPVVRRRATQDCSQRHRSLIAHAGIKSPAAIQPYPVAGGAKVAAHRHYEAKFSAGLIDANITCRAARRGRDRRQGPATAEILFERCKR